MSAIAHALRRLGSLNLGNAEMKEMLAIVADMEAAHAAEIVALKTELGVLKEKRKRKRTADARRVRDRREAARVAAESRDSECDIAGLWTDADAIVAPESRDIVSDNRATVAASPSPFPPPPSSPPHPPNNYLPSTPILIDDDAGAHANPTKSMISEEAHAIANAVARSAGFDRDSWPAGWYGSPWAVQKWLNDGCPGEVVKLAVETALKRKRDGPPDNFSYFAKPIAAAFADHQRPNPSASPRAFEEKINGNASRNRTVIDAGRDLVARLNAFDRAPDIGRGEGNSAPRLLPPK